MRPAFEKQRVPSVSVVPFYSVGNFSLSDDELTEVLETTQRAAIESLRSQGFEVIEPRAFRQYLTEHQASADFDEGVLLRSGLSGYFEPDEDASGPALEVTTIRRLHKEGKLPTDALLFGEVVYHTQTNCRVDPTEFNNQAEIAGETKASASATPCVVSHFRAKLVYAPTGETMWFNHRLLQTHSDQTSADLSKRNLAETVVRTLGGSHGINAFQSSEQQAALEDEADEANAHPQSDGHKKLRN